MDMFGGLPQTLKRMVGDRENDPKWSPPDSFPELTGDCGIDIETSDPDLKTLGSGWIPGGRGKILGVAVSWGENGENQGYWPIAHAEGNLDEQAVFSWLKDQAKKNDVHFVAHYSTYERGWFRKYDVKFANPINCTHAAAVLVDETEPSFSLDALLRNRLGERKDKSLFKAAAKMLGCKESDVILNLERLPSCYIGGYAEQDAGGCLRLWHVLQKELREAGTWEAYLRERDILDIATEMRWIGVRSSSSMVEQARVKCWEHYRTSQKRIHDLTGVNVEAWDAEALDRAFTQRGIKLPRTTRGAPSITKEWLKNCEDSLAREVRDLRRWDKARNTYVEPFGRKLINERIYPEWNTLRSDEAGAITGRFSSWFQTLPSADEGKAEEDREIGILIRSLVLPEEGEEWESIDYSQQEPRLAVHFAVKSNCPGAEEFARRYREDPSTDFHSMAAKFANIERKPAKIIGLGLMYGMGGVSLCQRLGFNTKTIVKMSDGRWVDAEEYPDAPGRRLEVAGDEGQEVLDRFDSGLPWVSAVSRKAKKVAESRGYVITLGGRHMHFPTHTDPNTGQKVRMFTHKALNSIIQPSAADQTKESMRILYRDFGIIPRVQVHDELGFSRPMKNDRWSSTVHEVMCNSFTLEVPMKVDPAYGVSWGEAKE